jgi:hypothetical protein
MFFGVHPYDILHYIFFDHYPIVLIGSIEILMLRRRPPSSLLDLNGMISFHPCLSLSPVNSAHPGNLWKGIVPPSPVLTVLVGDFDPIHLWSRPLQSSIRNQKSTIGIFVSVSILRLEYSPAGKAIQPVKKLCPKWDPII